MTFSSSNINILQDVSTQGQHMTTSQDRGET